MEFVLGFAFLCLILAFLGEVDNIIEDRRSGRRDSRERNRR